MTVTAGTRSPLTRRAFFVAAAIPLATALAACSTLKNYVFGPPTAKVRSIQIAAGINANQSTATAIDIVFVYTSSALGMLPKNGPDWFRQKGGLMISVGRDLDVVPTSIAPGLPAESEPLLLPLPKRRKDAIAVLSYANYLSADGQPVANISAYTDVMILLNRDTILYSDK